MLREERTELRCDQKVVCRDLRFSGQGGKLDGYSLAIAIRVIEQCSGGGIIEEVVVAVSGFTCSTGAEIG
jgi:hypothetical protein